MTQLSNEEQEFNELLKALEKPVKIKPPDDFTHKVSAHVMEHSNKKNLDINYMQWAAIALIILVNSLVYINTLAHMQDINDVPDSDQELEVMIEDYGLENYPYDTYMYESI